MRVSFWPSVRVTIHTSDTALQSLVDVIICNLPLIDLVFAGLSFLLKTSEPLQISS